MSNIGDMNIVYTIKQLQPLSLLFDKRFLFIGASISERNEINDFEIKKDKWEKVIYISLGSIFCDNKFNQMCFEVLKDTDYLVILKVGDQISVDVNEIPDNFIVRKFVAQLEVLKVADLIVCHGGMNSVSEALYFEVPIIAIPHSSDQPFVAKQIDKLKCGLHLEKKQLTKEVLKRSIDSVLNNARYKKNCIKVSESMKKAGGYKYAVDSIFQFKKRNILTELQEEAYSGEKQDRM